jgi:predicted GIY-YIG superfamily endonuclease
MPCEALAKQGDMYYVYFLRSLMDKTKKYSGVTANLKTRLEAHNNGKSAHTNKFKPWQLVAYVAFDDHAKALAFEKYIKQGSGHAFANRHLW